LHSADAADMALRPAQAPMQRIVAFSLAAIGFGLAYLPIAAPYS
jgi:hypothetical protein